MSFDTPHPSPHWTRMWRLRSNRVSGSLVFVGVRVGVLMRDQSGEFRANAAEARILAQR